MLTLILILIIIILVLVLYWEMKHPMSTRRKLALASWGPSTHPNMLGQMNINVEKTLQYLDELNQKVQDGKVTITSLIGKALGIAMKRIPAANCKMLFGKLIPLPTVDVCFLVSVGKSAGEGAADLGKVTVVDIHAKSLPDIAAQLTHSATKVRTGKDEDFNKAKPMIKMLPTWALGTIAGLTGFVSSALDWDVPALGVTKRAFGNAIVTSVAMFDIETAYAPPTPFARVCTYLTVGSIKKAAVVDASDKIVVQRQMSVTATIDHRFLDGRECGGLATIFKKVLENPQEYLDSNGNTNWSAVETIKF